MEPKLRLVKSGEKKGDKKQLQFPDSQYPKNDQVPDLSPAEQAEAARFRALTRKKARLQAKVRRLVNKLKQSDDQTPHAA